LAGDAVSDETMGWLLEGLRGRRVRHLQLRANPGLGDEGIAALAKSDALAEVTSLDLMGTGVRLAGVRALVGRPLPLLRHLHLAECDDACLRAIADSPNLPNLTTLAVSGGREFFRLTYSAEGLMAVADSDRLPHLSALLAYLPNERQGSLVECLLSGRLYVGGDGEYRFHALSAEQRAAFAARAGTYRASWDEFDR
jgi:hypothetical protein